MSLLPAGVHRGEGHASRPTTPSRSPAPTAQVFAKGLVRLGSVGLRDVAGRRTTDLPEGMPHEVVHRDDLVVLP